MKPSLDAIRESLIVRADPGQAFAVFTEGMGTWWPVESYSRAVSELAHEKVEVARLEFRPRMGGAIIEHLRDGRTLPWGQVIEWRLPHRVVIAWKPHSEPEPPTEVDVTFRAHNGGTLVELEHRGWGRLSHGFGRTLYPIYERGWPTTLARFAAAANKKTPDATLKRSP